MSNLDQTLYFLSLTFTVAMLLAIIVPYWLGRSDLATTFNIYLAGSALFLGLSGIASASERHYADYHAEVFQKFYTGIALFYGLLFLVYWRAKLPRRLAGRTLRKWPGLTIPTMLFLSLLSTAIGVAALFPLQIPFFGQMLFQTAMRIGPFAIAFALAAWNRDRKNPLLAGLLILIVAVSVVLSVAFGGQRRLLVGALLIVPFYWYWTSLRYKSAQRVVMIFAAVLIPANMFLAGFDAVRRRSSDKQGVARAVESVGKAKEQFGVSRRLSKYAQNSVEASLAAIYLYASRDKTLESSLFHALHFIAVNPIPRHFWPEKPKSLGHFLPIDVQEELGVMGYRAGEGGVNWGVSAVGQGYHDGGLFVIAVYAIIVGIVLRFFDEMLIRQPGNPFLIGALGTASGHLVGWPRGGFDIMGLQIIGSVITLFVIWILARLFIGIGLEYPRTDHVHNMPNLAFYRHCLKKRT